MIKLTFIIVILLFCFALYGLDIEQDKAIHFTANAGLYILADCVCEWTGTPRYIPFVICVGVSVGKELNDPFFNWKDLIADGAGLTFGVTVRFADTKWR